MNHLTDEQLGARLDGALAGRALEEADRHLAACAPCRDALAALTAQDEALAVALAHDPGEAYFAAFPARVEDRLRAEGLRGAQKRLRDEGWMGWWRAPRRVAWAAAVATVVAGAAIVLVTTREERLPALGDRAIERHVAQQEPPAPTQATTPAREGMAADQSGQPGARGEAERSQPAPAQAKALKSGRSDVATRDLAAPTNPPPTGSAPARMREVGTRPTAEARYAQPPVSPVPAPGGGVRVGRRSAATPMAADVQPQSAPSTEAAAPREEPAPMTAMTKSVEQQEQRAGGAEPPLATGLAAAPTVRATGEVALCGHVLDAQGHAVARAVVTLVSLGRTAHSAEQGDFCMDAPPGSYELSVMAVGFEPERLQVRVGGERSDVQVTLRAISVLDGKAAPPEMKLSGGSATRSTATKTRAAPAPATADPFAGETAATRARAGAAFEATRSASKYPSIASWQKAITGWTEVANLVKTPAGRTEARYRLAEAWVSEWRYNPTPQVKNQALMACMGVLSGTPTAVQRNDAMKWMAEVRRGLGPH